jgi:hypothetical protein
MQLIDFEFLPYPNSIFLLTGVSVATLLYINYSETINKLPQQISSSADSITKSATALGTSIKQGASKILTPIAQAVPVTEAIPSSQTSNFTSNISNTVASLNPFGNATAPTQPTSQQNTGVLASLNPFGNSAHGQNPEPSAPPKIGGTKKRKNKRDSKKTKRSRK